MIQSIRFDRVSFDNPEEEEEPPPEDKKPPISRSAQRTPKMGEIKSVKVDNWGVFFLQKLQNFFNKTDYCDLTLQFNDNSQLKVHRLVLSACTDYFNVLERTSDTTDQILIMPRDFQADVVVPIVNFMYTGTLEFEFKMYDRLFRTAKHMNMTVLVKLLEAHRKSAPKPHIAPVQQRPLPVVLNRGLNMRQPARVVQSHSGATVRTVAPAATHSRSYSATGPVGGGGGRVLTRGGRQSQVTRPQYRTEISSVKPPNSMPVKNITQFFQAKPLPETISIVSKYKSDAKAITAGPSRFEPAEEELLVPDDLDTFNTISYESQPLMKAKEEDFEEYEEIEMAPVANSSRGSGGASTFEQLRKGYTNVNKRAASQSLTSPPTKKPNLQDVKEYTEAAKLRKQLEAEELEDDPNYVYDDDTHFSDDDDDEIVQKPKPSSVPQKSPQQDNFEQPESQIIVKDNSGTVDHAKIISEVLKKYPHLVKNNKNIKLKIMQKSQQPEVESVPELATSSHVVTAKPPIPIQVKKEKISPGKQTVLPPITQIKKEKVDVQLKVPPSAVPSSSASTSTPKIQPKKIDSKTMHALIAKGAENMTGPWLCLRCGIGGRPISIPSYKSFRRHLINVHHEKIDPRICEHCGWKAIKKQELIEHYQNEHNIKIKVETAVKSQGPQTRGGGAAAKAVQDAAAAASTSKKDIQHCIYCNKVFSKESLLYTHMKMAHKEKAREDGVIDFSDDEHDFDEADKYVPNDPTAGSAERKVKILSNISIPKGFSSTTQQQIVNLEPSSEAEAMSNVASGIATSLALVDNSVVMDDGHFHPNQFIQDTIHHESWVKKDDHDIVTDSSTSIMTKLVTADGAELELTQSQKEEIISQLQSQGAGELGDTNVVMVLNEEHFDGSDIMNSDSQNIMVVYSQADDGSLKAATEAMIASTATATSETVVVSAIEQATPMDWQEEHSLKHDELMEPQLEEQSTQLEKNSAVEDEPEQTETREKENESTKSPIPAANKPDEDKLKLISALEGDWSDDEEEVPAPTVPKITEPVVVPKPIKEETPPPPPTQPSETESEKEKVLFVVSTDTNISPEVDTNKAPAKNTSATSEKESDLSNILGDWLGAGDDDTNKSEIKPADEAEDSSPSKEIAEGSDQNISIDTAPPDEDEDRSQGEEENSTKEDANTSATIASENSELKTLINDWEDDEDGDL